MGRASPSGEVGGDTGPSIAGRALWDRWTWELVWFSGFSSEKEYEAYRRGGENPVQGSGPPSRPGCSNAGWICIAWENERQMIHPQAERMTVLDTNVSDPSEPAGQVNVENGDTTKGKCSMERSK